MSARETRRNIVEAADGLIYRRGYENTSFADIAGAVRISRGNFYYHFKSKDEILDAVIDQRLSMTRRLLKDWEDGAAGPADCIRSFIRILLDNRADIENYGCPVGTLATELAKLNHEAKSGANELFDLFRSWLRGQFELLGCGDDADRFALHLLARSQGVATLATAYRDEAFIRREVLDMCDWLDARAVAARRTANIKSPKEKQR